MNKAELITAIATEAHLPKSKAASALDAVLNTISKALGHKESVSLVGFGSFTVQRRAERNGCDPRTGKAITIPATTVPVFRPGKGLRKAASGSS